MTWFGRAAKRPCRTFFQPIPLGLILAAALCGQPAPSSKNAGILLNSSCAADSEKPPASPRDFFAFLNYQRVAFKPHEPWNGYPWRGAYTSTLTWPVELTWDDGLAAKAQVEATRLANEEQPKGERYRHQMANLLGDKTEALWLRGLESDEYELVAKSRPDTEADYRWHAPGNGTARMAVFYQTGLGTHNVKNRLGVAKACLPNGEAWWVLLFAK